MKDIELWQGDCLELMKDIPDESVDMVLCDLPYGTTASSWDAVIPFDEIWEQYERVIKVDGAIALTASGRFTHELIQSNIKLYKYKWVWVKNKVGNFVNAKNRPMTKFEEVLIFSKGNTANGSKNKMKYYPQGLVEVNVVKKNGKSKFGSVAGKRPSHKEFTVQKYTNYPNDILEFSFSGKPMHPAQKPLDLMEYLIKTYTNEGELVLDNCMGSGTTGVACKKTNRNFIGIELDENYFEIAKNRILETNVEG